jgi:transcriptional regulator with XRE-family HTH domain
MARSMGLTRKRLVVAKTLREFIREEMNKRDMSARQFADLLGVAPSTITTHLDDKSNTEPTLSFLRKLARQTGVPLASIIAMAFPDVAGEISDIPPDVLLLAIRFNHLPEPIRDVIKRLINSEK